MLLRKINAVLSLLSTLLLWDHSIFLAVWMHSGLTIPKHQTPLPWILFCLMLVHGVLSILLGILGHKGAEKRKCKEYPHKNLPTLLQRMGGMLLIPAAVLHVMGTAGGMVPPPFVHAVLPPVFFTLALSHVAISASKALITLGIGSAKFVRVADWVVKLICAVTLIADISGFYLYLV